MQFCLRALEAAVGAADFFVQDFFFPIDLDLCSTFKYSQSFLVGPLKPLKLSS